MYIIFLHCGIIVFISLIPPPPPENIISNFAFKATEKQVTFYRNPSSMKPQKRVNVSPPSYLTTDTLTVGNKS